MYNLPQKAKIIKKKEVISVLNPGAFFGFDELINNEKYQYSATA